jgi:outer membrane protein assembly factor BamB
MNTRLVRFVLLAALALLGTGADCGRHRDDFPADPMPPTGPDSTWAGAPTSYRVTTTIGRDRIRYVMDWDGTMDTTGASYASGETAAVSHVWNSPGEVSVQVQAINDAYPEKASEWSLAKTVKVVANQPPVVDSVHGPSYTPVGVPAEFTCFVSDPDHNHVSALVAWGDGKDTTSGDEASPCRVELSHAYGEVGTFEAVFRAKDSRGTMSAPETLAVTVGGSGGVSWYMLGRGWTSALVASDGSEECVYCSVEEYPGDQPILRAFGAAGGVKHRYGGVAALLEEPACCASTGHVIIGGDGGEFHAVEMDLDEAWSWIETEWQRWGPMAINGARIYLKTNYEGAYYFTDSVTKGVRVATFEPSGHQTGAPVVDAQGSVYFGTDSGYLYKMDPDFGAPIWRAPLQARGEIYGPIIGGDGTIYCTSDSSYLFAIDAATGTPKWRTILDGEAPRPALGPSALFVGTLNGKVYSVDPTTGVVNWQKQFGADAFETTPIVVIGGYVYLQNSADMLYCINQADGLLIWSCDCPKYLPRAGVSRSGRARRAWPPDNAPNPSILSNGNIIVVGTDALYCVAGYPERPLDPTAPWPKWQHDRHNTGYVNGGAR